MRRKFIIESEAKIKELNNKEPVYKSLERKYVTNFEIPELEQRKKILENLRNLPTHTKISSVDIMKHSKEYEIMRKK